MNRRWICSDVWMDIFPSFDRLQLGLKMALLSDRFDVLVDAHFDGKSELTIWNTITICKDIEPKAKLLVYWMEFLLPDHPLPNKIRFKDIWIEYIDHSVIEFLRSNEQIWDRSGTELELSIANVQPIWDVFVSRIWPIFATNIRQLYFPYGDDLDNLRRLISPTILTDLDQLNSINSGLMCPDVLLADDFDGPTNAISAGQALSKWLHTPTKDGQPKRLRCFELLASTNFEWVNNFKEAFVCARASAVSYTVYFRSTPNVPFELVNERTKEMLTLKKVPFMLYPYADEWMLKRCPIIGEKKDGNSYANLNNVYFNFDGYENAIGPLSPPADKSDENLCSSAAGPSSDQRNE